MKKYIPRPTKREYITFGLLLAEIILFGIFAPNFLTVDNIVRVIQNNVEIALISIGMTIVMLLGGIDLSVGAVMGVVAVVEGYMIEAGMGTFMILIVALSIGISVGLINGLLITKCRIPDMIATLATQNIWKAVIFGLLGGKWLTSLKPAYASVTKAKILGIPLLLIIVILVYGFFYYLLMYRKFGRHLYATGCNPKAAVLSGINTDRIRIVSYCITGAMAAIAGMLYIARMGSVEMTIGTSTAISCIAAVTLGGVGSQGKGPMGSILGTLAGVFFIGFLKNGIVILGIPSLLENCFIGLLIVISVMFDSVSNLESNKNKKESGGV